MAANSESYREPRGNVVRFRERSTALEATVDLLARIHRGDEAALETLIRRCLAPLRRIGHNRLPRQARSMTDTDDLVQDALVSTVRQLPHFVCRERGALLAYLRRVVRNRVIDEARKCVRQAAWTVPLASCAEESPSPLQRMLGQEDMRRYRAALLQLKARDRALIVLRVEQRLSYRAIAAQLHMTSANAARVASVRATRRFVSALTHV